MIFLKLISFIKKILEIFDTITNKKSHGLFFMKDYIPKFIYPYLQVITIVVFLGLVFLLFITPYATSLIWTFAIPLIPISLLIIGYSRWRKICPLAWFAKITQHINIFKKHKLPHWFEENFYSLQFGILAFAFSARLYILNNDALLLASFFLIVAFGVLISGLFLSGRSWCNYLCPVGVVEKIYMGSNAHMQHINSACSSCSACKSHCPDIDMESSYWKEKNNKQKKFVFYSFAGLVFGFYFYYYLEAGNWAYYFDGTWTDINENQTILSSLMYPGFFFLPEIPRVLAVPITLILSSAFSYFIFTYLEKFLYSIAVLKSKENGSVEHITKSVAAFSAFNIFYIFAGAPTFSQFPYAYALLHFVVVVVSSTLLWKEIHREERFYIQERFARKILKKLKGEDVKGKNLKEIYYTYANEQKNHGLHLETYKETVLELMADGIVSKEDMNVLDKMRMQLGITNIEHKKAMKDLEKEYPELFSNENDMSSEVLFQMKGYREALSIEMQKVENPKTHNYYNIQRDFLIDDKTHAKILNELLNSESIYLDNIYQNLEKLLQLCKNRVQVPLNTSIELNYLSYNIEISIDESIQYLQKNAPSSKKYEQLGNLLNKLDICKFDNIKMDEIEERFFLIAKEISKVKAKKNVDTLEYIKDVVKSVFDNEFHDVFASAILVTINQNLVEVFKQDIQKCKDNQDATISEIADYALKGLSIEKTLIYKESLIHAVPLFNTLEQQHVELLSQNVKMMNFKKDDYLIRQGEEGDKLYIISKGSAKVFIDTDDGEKEVAIVHEHDYIGEIALFSGEKRTANVQALQDIEAMILSVDALKDVIHYSPSISFNMMKQMTLRLLDNKNS